MPVDMSAVNPIIQAMIQRVQAQQESAQLEQRKKESEDDKKLKEQQLKQQENRDKAEDAAAKAAHDLAIQQFNLSKAQREFEKNAKILDFADKLIGERGISPDALSAPSGNPRKDAPKILNIPGLGSLNIDPNSIPTKATRDQQELDLLGRKTGVQAQALEPFKAADDIRQFENQKKLKELEQANALNLLDTRGKQELEVLKKEQDFNEKKYKFEEANANYRAQLTAQTRLSAAGQGLTADDNVVDSYINDYYVTGNIANVPVKWQGVVRSNVPKGWTPLSSKTDKDQLDGLPLVEGLISDVKRLAEAGSGVGGRLSVLIGFGDAAEAKREVESKIGNLSRVFGGEKGVLTKEDVVRMSKGVYSILNKDKTNKETPESLENFLYDKLSPIVSKFSKDPDQIRQILFARGLDPDEVLGKIAKAKAAKIDTNSKGGPRRTVQKIEIEPGKYVDNTPENKLKYGIQ